MRNTIQRQIILNTVRKMRAHPTVEDVYNEIQKDHPSMSKATVYRNLHQLADKGEIISVPLPDSPERIDKRLSRHYHFCCGICGGIFDIDMYLSEINDTIQNTYGFQVDGHDVIFKGICLECKAKNN